MSDSPVNLTAGIPETILPAASPALRAELDAALSAPEEVRRDALAGVVAIAPRWMDGWAELGEITTDPIERYAYFRIGYHRGLDALRANGWRGSGYVRWQHPTNRGFLRCLLGLGAAAEAIGEADEVERIAQFIAMLDPSLV